MTGSIYSDFVKSRDSWGIRRMDILIGTSGNPIQFDFILRCHQTSCILRYIGVCRDCLPGTICIEEFSRIGCHGSRYKTSCTIRRIGCSFDKSTKIHQLGSCVEIKSLVFFDERCQTFRIGTTIKNRLKFLNCIIALSHIKKRFRIQDKARCKSNSLPLIQIHDLNPPSS